MAHTATPWQVIEVENEGDYGDGGPDCRSGFNSFAIADNQGRVLFDSLGRDHMHTEVEEIHDDEYQSVTAQDRLAKRDAEFIVRACNAHGDLVNALEQIIEKFESDPDDLETMDAGISIARAALAALAKAGAA